MRATNEVKSTEGAATVTFDTLGAAQELRGAGFEDRQAEAVVTTISTAVSETVATKSDIQLLRSEVQSFQAGTKADMKLLRTEVQSFQAVTKADMELLRADMQSFQAATKAEMESFQATTKADMKLLRADMELLRKDMAAMENKIVLKLGGLMVTMTFVLLAVGPFYIRWVLSLMSAQ